MRLRVKLEQQKPNTSDSSKIKEQLTVMKGKRYELHTQLNQNRKPAPGDDF
jgi:hypothetical protein